MRSNIPGKYPPPIIVDILRCLALFISKILWRIEFHGTENIPQSLKSGLLVVPNHQTYFDPFWISLPIRRKLRFMAWDKAFDWFLVGDFIRFLGAFPVNLERGGKQAVREAVKSLDEGATLIIFPEGSRGFSDGKLLPFKTGAVRIALETGVPILPVTVRGANKIWARDMKLPQLGKVEIHYHPIFIASENPENTDLHDYIADQTEKLKNIIESKLN